MAIAAISRLAELHDQPGHPLTAAQIAAARGLPRPAIAKTLSALARAGLIRGAPGRGGGYRLTRAPAEISVLDVAKLFENQAKPTCPYRIQESDAGEACPLHESFAALQRLIEDYLRALRLDLFARAYRNDQDAGPRRTVAGPNLLAVSGAGADGRALPARRSKPARSRGASEPPQHPRP